MDVSTAVPVASAGELERWFTTAGQDATSIIVAIFKRASGRQTVGLVALQEVALCHGWVDTQTQRIDADRYAIRFVPRRPGSTWGPKNREMARRMLADGRMTTAGIAVLAPDLRPRPASASDSR